MLPAILPLVWDILVDGVGFFTAYVSGGTAFPQPLKPEEESRLLRRMLAEDKEARNTLIEHNLRLVAHVIKKFERTGEDIEDLISIGTIGLIKAINTFRPERKTRLATYAARCIENEVLMHLRTTKKSRSQALLQDPISSDPEGNEVSLLDVMGSDNDAVHDEVELRVEQERLQEHLRRLSRREQTVLSLRYGLGREECWTQREVSRILGISRSYVSRIEKRAIGKLQGQMCLD